MATTAIVHEPAQHGVGERLLTLAGNAATHVAALWRATQNRRSVAKLLEWDDRMLKDIGLTQGDVLSVMALPAAEDPSLRLRTLSAERRMAIRAEALDRLSRGTEFNPSKQKRRRFRVLTFES